MHRLTLTSNFKITLPKKVRDAMNLQIGDEVITEMTGENTCAIRPMIPSLRDRSGSLSKSVHSRKSLFDMEKAINETLVRRQQID